MTTAAPLNTGSAQSAAPASGRPLTLTPTKNTPTILPGTLQRPGPRIEVEPGNAAASDESV